MTPQPVVGIVLAWGLGIVSYFLWQRASARADVRDSRYTTIVRRASLVIGMLVGAVVAWFVYELIQADAIDRSLTVDKIIATAFAALTAMLYFSVIVSDIYAIWALVRGPTRGGAALAIVGGPILAILLLFAGGVILDSVNTELS